MPRNEVTVSIARSPAEVFAVLSDVENTHKWYPKPVTEKWTSEGPVGVGSTRRSEARAFGIGVKNDAEVTVFDRDRALGLRSITGPVPFDIDIRISPIEEGAGSTGSPNYDLVACTRRSWPSRCRRKQGRPIEAC